MQTGQARLLYIPQNERCWSPYLSDRMIYVFIYTIYTLFDNIAFLEYINIRRPNSCSVLFVLTDFLGGLAYNSTEQEGINTWLLCH